MPVNNLFQIRRGTQSQWNSANPVLASGEPGYDSTNNLFKIGDGINNWNSLKSVLEITGNAAISGVLSATSGNFTNLNVNNIQVSVSGHSHIISDVSGLQNALDSKQPSGDYSVVGHSHVSSDITDFNSSVSGLISVVNISQGSGILVSENNKDFTITSDSSYIQNIVQDNFNTSLIGGSGISLNYDSINETLTISATGLQPSGNYSIVGHTHTLSSITDAGAAASRNVAVSGDASSSDVVLGTDSRLFDNRTPIDASVTAEKIAQDQDMVFRTLTIKSNTGSANIISLNRNFLDYSDGQQSWFNVAPSGGYAYVKGSYLYWRARPIEIAYGGTNSNTASGALVNLGAASVSHSHGNISNSGTIGSTSGLLVTTGESGILITSSGIPSSYINNFNTSVSGLLPVKDISSGDNISVSSLSGVYTVSATGLQPSGNYSLVGHSHMSSDITDFNSSVSGLLPVKNIIGSGNINVSNSNGSFTISSSGVTISNEANNRIITSDGLGGIVAESNLTFDGNLLSVSGNLVAVSGTYNQLIFNTSLPDPDLSQGQLQWNNSEGTLDLGFTDTYSQHVGEELHYRIRNNTASTLTKGTAVYASGLTPGGNNRIEVAPFTADGSIREVRFMGLVTENISNGVNGYTTQFGYIRGIDTRGNAASNGYAGKLWDAGEPSWSEGDILYAHPTVAGKLTKVEPKHSISVAIILNRHQNQGKIFVRPTSYGHLDDNHDVAVSGATNGQFLQYNSATDYWVPSSSGNFTSLTINNVPVSTGINVNNFGDNRILTSTGTSTGINAESNLNFDGLKLNLVGSNLGQNNQPTIEIKSENVTGSAQLLMDSINSFQLSNRIIISKNKGSTDNLLPLSSGDAIGTILYRTVNASGNYPTGDLGATLSVARIRVDVDKDPVLGEDAVGTKIIFNTSSGPLNQNNTLILDSSGVLTNSGNGYFVGSLTVDNGLSAPTPIFSLGTVSGNVSVSYGIDKQIQTLTLNGTTTNFIKGSWPAGSFSADVLLEITVNSTTTVSFALVDDWYNPVPSFTPGKYLVLLRSMGSTIQGHYIGNKTN